MQRFLTNVPHLYMIGTYTPKYTVMKGLNRGKDFIDEAIAEGIFKKEFTQTQDNVGKVEGDGWEVDLGVDLFRNDGDGFNWNSRVNFTKSEQIVTEQDDDQIIFAAIGICYCCCPGAD